MSDINFSDDELETYVIGFTENQHLPNTLSPSPTDHNISHPSFAQDYAERSNRGTLQKFLNRSFDLDRQQRLSMSKIHTNMLDLMFELSVRRKVATPLLSKSAMEFHRSDSRFSDISDASDTSIKTSSSLPLIEVQQLPPIAQKTSYGHKTNREDFQLPDITSIHEGHKKNKKITKDKYKRSQSAINNQENHSKLHETFEKVMQNHGEQKQSDLMKKEENKENDSKIVRFSMKEDNDKSVGDEIKETDDESKVEWKDIDNKIHEANKIARERGESFNEYRGRYYSVTPLRKTSFCQSSYRERSEKERMDNIRRRHASQTKVGPLDFNKLRRQIMLGRSRTFCF